MGADALCGCDHLHTGATIRGEPESLPRIHRCDGILSGGVAIDDQIVTTTALQSGACLLDRAAERLV